MIESPNIKNALLILWETFFYWLLSVHLVQRATNSSSKIKRDKLLLIHFYGILKKYSQLKRRIDLLKRKIKIICYAILYSYVDDPVKVILLIFHSFIADLAFCLNMSEILIFKFIFFSVHKCRNFFIFCHTFN
jgi:hypothetical protein